MAYREHNGSEYPGGRSPGPDYDDAVPPRAERDEDAAGEARPSPADEWFGDDGFDSGPIAPPPPYAQPQTGGQDTGYPPVSRPEARPEARPDPRQGPGGYPVREPEFREGSGYPAPESEVQGSGYPASGPEPRPDPRQGPGYPAREPHSPTPSRSESEPPRQQERGEEPRSDVSRPSPLGRNRPQIQRLLQDAERTDRASPEPVADDVPEPEPLPPLDAPGTYSGRPVHGTDARPDTPAAPAPWTPEPQRPPAPPRPSAARPQAPPVPPPTQRYAPPSGPPQRMPPPQTGPYPGPPPPATAPPAPPVRPQQGPSPARPDHFGPAGRTPPGGTPSPEVSGFDPRGTAPENADNLKADTLVRGRRQAPSSGWRKAVHTATLGLVHPGEAPAELRRRELTNRARTYVVGGHHRVAVLSLKGGVGKTTTTVALGSILASLRGDRVLAVDANPDRGTLSDKLRLETAATIRDLLNEKEMISRYADIRGFTSQAASRLEVLASDRDPAVSEAFSEFDYREVSRILEHFYSITLTDCGTGLLHSAMRGVLGLADQIVLVSTPSVDGARSASATLDWLEAHEYGYLVRGAVVVLSMVRQGGKSSVDLQRLEDHFNSRCRSVVQIPWDSHLEEGAEVHLEQLHPATRDAYLELAATVGEAFAWPR